MRVMLNILEISTRNNTMQSGSVLDMFFVTAVFENQSKQSLMHRFESLSETLIESVRKGLVHQEKRKLLA